MPTCSKCNEDAGKDPVITKTGRCFCESCFAKMHPVVQPVTKPEPRRGVEINVETVLLVLLVIGLGLGGFFYYRAEQESKRLAMAADQRAVELAEQHRREDEARNAAILARQAAERAAKAAQHDAERVRREREQKIIVDAAAAANDLRKTETEIKQNERDVKRVERAAEIKQSIDAGMARVKNEATLANTRETAARNQQRNNEIDTLNRDFAGFAKILQGAEVVKSELGRKMAIHNNIFQARNTGLQHMYQKHKEYMGEAPGGNLWDITWDTTPIISSSVVGATTVTQESTFPQIAQQYNNIAKDAREQLHKIQELQAQIQNIDAGNAEVRLRAEQCRTRLVELGAGDPMAAIMAGPPQGGADPAKLPPNPFAARKAGFKTLYKKDGSTIQVQSVMTVDKETRYKDESGEWKTLSTDEVDRIEANSGK